MNLKTPTVALLLAAAALTGCKSVNTAEPAELRSNPTVIADKVVVEDPSLGRVAQVVDIREARVGNGFLKVQATVRNTTLSRKSFNYRVDWIDEGGMEMDTHLSRWTQMSLAGKETGTITAVAPSPKAVDYRLKLVEAD